MSISDKLNIILNIKNNIKQAIIDKGGQIDNTTPFSDYPDAINNIQTGGGSSISMSVLGSILDNSYTGVLDLSNTRITKIKMNCFAYMEKVTEIILPNTVQIIDSYACYLTNNLTKINFPEGLTKINSDAFSCSKINPLILPSTINTIGSRAFSMMSGGGRRDIYIKATTPPKINKDTFDTSYINKIYIPTGTLNAYITASNWSDIGSRYFEEMDIADMSES